MKNSRTALAIFDLDRTLIRDNSSYRFCRHLYREGVYSHLHLAFAIFYRIWFPFSGMTLTEFHKKVFRKLVFGFRLDQFVDHVGAFVQELLPKAINPAVYRVLCQAQDRGDRTVILSNSPSFLVEPIARFFEVDDWKATQYSVDKDKTLCNIAHLMEGTNKAHYLVQARQKLGITKENVTVYTDSHHDLPLLLEAGTPVVVNPDKKLLKIARQNCWSMI